MEGATLVRARFPMSEACDSIHDTVPIETRHLAPERDKGKGKGKAIYKAKLAPLLSARQHAAAKAKQPTPVRCLSGMTVQDGYSWGHLIWQDIEARSGKRVDSSAAKFRQEVGQQHKVDRRRGQPRAVDSQDQQQILCEVRRSTKRKHRRHSVHQAVSARPLPCLAGG